MQTRLVSFIESCVNIGIGYFIAVIAQILIYPLYGIEVSLTAQFEISAIFTVISIARSYLVRRGFNWLHMVRHG